MKPQVEAETEAIVRAAQDVAEALPGDSNETVNKLLSKVTESLPPRPSTYAVALPVALISAKFA